METETPEVEVTTETSAPESVEPEGSRNVPGARSIKDLRSFASSTSMATRLPAAVLLVSLISLLAAIIVAVNTGRDLGQDLTDDRLGSLSSSGALDVAGHMNGLSNTAQGLAASPQAAVALERLTEAHSELLAGSTDGFAEEAESVVEELEETYIEPLRASGRDVQLRDLIADNPASLYLLFNYGLTTSLGTNPETVDDARDGSEWSATHALVHPVYRDVVNRRDLVDLYLIEPENGYIVYSVRKGPDLGTSLSVGPFSGSVLATTVDKVIDDPGAGAVTSDLQFYDPTVTTPVGVVAAPVMDGGDLAGVLALMYDSPPITDILTDGGDWDAGGFPPTGQSFLIGVDGTTRSEPRTFLEDPLAHLDTTQSLGLISDSERVTIDVSGTTVLSQHSVDTTVNAALDGDTSVAVRTTMVGEDAFSTTAAVPIEGVEWYVVSEVDTGVAQSDLGDFEELLIVGTSTFVVLLAFLAVAWAARIVRPVRAISDRLVGGADRFDPIEVPSRSPIEFHRLAASFGSMADALADQHTQLAAARADRLALLREMLPPGMAERVATGDLQALDEVPQASVAVATILGLGALVRMGDGNSDRELVDQLHSELDDLALGHGLERVKIVGDAYFASCGHDRPYIDHAPRSVAFLADAIDAVRELGLSSGSGLDVASGVHTGPVTVGMTGSSRLLYDVWGATVTTAHHLARQAARGQILASEETCALLPETVVTRRLGATDDGPWIIDAASVRGRT